MTVGALAVMTKVIFSIHMTGTNDSWGSGSVGKRYKWHMHMTKEVGVVGVMTDGIRCCVSDDQRYKWHMHMTKADVSRGSGSDDRWH